METADPLVLKERVLEEVECLGFPIEMLYKEFESTCNKWSEVWISRFTDKMLEKYQNKPDVHSKIEDCKQAAIEIYKEVIKLRGENLRDCVDAYDIFHDGYAPSDSEEDDDDESKTPQADVDIYDKDKDQQVENELKELYAKKSMCYAMKKKLAEIKMLNKTVSEMVDKANQ